MEKMSQEAWHTYFARLAVQKLAEAGAQTAVRFGTYTKDDLLGYMKTPESNAKNIRDASKYMFNASPHYRRLILYYAFLSMWQYTLTPLKYNPGKTSAAALRKGYLKAAEFVERINLRHEMQKAFTVAFRDDVLYGAVWTATDSFFIQAINPDWCRLSSIEDGTYLFEVDMSRIQEARLWMYPPEFSGMYAKYKAEKVKWQAVPSDICFCLKANETVEYPFPPFASVLPSIFDVEEYKSLQKTKSRLDNYKALGMQIPLNDRGEPSVDYPLAEKYFEDMVNVLPEYVGAFLSPMDVKAWEFEKSGNTASVDEVERAVESMWGSSGTSSLLFGNAKNNTAAALRLSITTDEELAFGLVTQAERIINRFLKNLGGSVRFRINVLPTTWFNWKEYANAYKEAGTYGFPLKSSYSAALGLTPADMPAMNDIEMGILGLGDMTPLTSSHTMPADAGGRPTAEESGEELGEAGEKTRDADSNANKID